MSDVGELGRRMIAPDDDVVNILGRNLEACRNLPQTELAIPYYQKRIIYSNVAATVSKALRRMKNSEVLLDEKVGKF